MKETHSLLLLESLCAGSVKLDDGDAALKIDIMIGSVLLKIAEMGLLFAYMTTSFINESDRYFPSDLWT